jgi:transcriptional regulator with XRE-family HTH domain
MSEELQSIIEETQANPLLERLAQNVQNVREHYGWSLATLAERAGITVSIVKHLLRGRSNPSISAVIRMANAAGLSLKELVESDVDVAALQPEETLVPHYRDPEAMATAIGPRTRAYRMRENWSRRKFIEHAKISKGMLHYIVSSTVEPSVAMVERLATAFSMSFSEFVEVVESPVIAIARSSDNGQQLLHHFDSTERVELDDFRLAGRQRVSTPTAPPGSTAMLYVVEGAIRVSFESEHHLLQNGDAVLLMTDRPYTVASSTAAPARFLRFARKKANHSDELSQVETASV